VFKRELPSDPARAAQRVAGQLDEGAQIATLAWTHPSRKNRRSTVFEEIDEVFVDVLAVRDDLEDVLCEPLIRHNHVALGARIRSPRVLYTPSDGSTAVFAQKESVEGISTQR